MRLQSRAVRYVDHVVTGLLATLVCGALLAFGGAVWWAGPAIAGLAVLLVVCVLARFLLSGQGRVVASPAVVLGVAGMALAVLQLAPLPGAISGKLAPRARQVHALGVMPSLVMADDPQAAVPAVGHLRTPATVDRSATVRWLLRAACCLAVLVVVMNHVDRIGRTVVVLGAVVAAFFLATTIGLVQWLSGAEDLFQVVRPSATSWAPTMEDWLAGVPGSTSLRSVEGVTQVDEAWALARVSRAQSVGSLVGGPGGYLALSAMALPLALGLLMHVLNPRSNRERIVDRLRTSEHGGPAVILFSLLLLGAYLTGLLGGAWVLGPIFLGVLLAGLPTLGTGLRVAGLGFTLLVVLAGGGGAWTRVAVEGAQRGPMVESVLPAVTEGDAEAWGEAARVARSFPILGAGMGSYPMVEPYFKKRDMSATSAGSSILQWWAEAGLTGAVLLGVGLLAILARLPRALGRVNRVDRPLAFGLLGAMAGFMAYSAVQWSVELLAIAVAASALLGVCERWLCGGTDLFVEPV